MCNTCKNELSFDLFGSNKGGKFGLRSSCKLCEQKRKNQFYISNKNKIIAKKKIYARQQLDNNPLFKLQLNVRSLIRNSIKNRGFAKNTKTFQLLQCSFEEFKKHIETQFTQDMNWDNYGHVWTYDHICPISQAKTELEIINLQHFLNWAPIKDNSSKSDKKTQLGEVLCKRLLNRNWIE